MSLDTGEAERPTDAALLERFRRTRNAPKATQTLGFEMLRVDQAAMEVEAAFLAREEWTNPMGVIQGGFLMAMLDEVMSVAGVVASGLTMVMPTLEMKTSFLLSAKPGRLIGLGRVRKWGRTIAFTEGELRDEQGRLLATATATAMPRPIAPKA
jgi:uncharacterized protein (TIGR00369 family)